MKRSLLGIVAATALCAPAASFAADAIYGVWVREGHPTDKLEFYDCSGKLCARGVLPMLDGSPPPIVLRSAAKTGPNSWKGDLFNPEDGKTYTGKITYDSPTQLTLSGCLVAFLCQSETWTRISGPTKPKAETKPEAKAEDKATEKSQEKAHAEGKPPETKATEKGGEKAPAKTGEARAKPAKPAEGKAAEGKATEARPAEGKPAARPRAKAVEEEAN
ncbi:MAG: DUF2147 domain-containing protein [Methylocystis sp.]|uniref:DUF2147 domain-containing protein n=1 Tax=Methylocystis sp. TaxID=1911079 RepID=UPI003DA5BF50